MIISRNKGFWRIDAIGRLSKKISKGQIQLEYLKNLITLHEKNNNKTHSFLQINSVKPYHKKINFREHPRSKSSQTFFVTQIPSYNKKIRDLNRKLFMNEDEENIYNPIELHPFEIKYTRNRDENQKFFNVQKIKKEIERNYNYIRNEQIKNRPFSSYYKNKMKNDFFGYESKNSASRNISLNNYYSNNKNMSKKRKKGYKLYFNSNTNDNIHNTINQNWTNTFGKKRIISAYLKNKVKGDIFGEENELFENIKKNEKMKFLLNNTTQNRNADNFSTLTSNTNFISQKNITEQINSNFDINKEQTIKRIFSSINSEKRIDLNLNNGLGKNNYKTLDRKKDTQLNHNLGKNIYKLNYFNKSYYKNKKYNSTTLKNENENENNKLKKRQILKIK
jgi:hypothetical protein